MTRTEDRLIAALESAATDIRVEDARPLIAPGRRRPGQAGPRRRVRRAAALAATSAVAVSLVVIAALVAVNVQRPSPGPIRTDAYIGGSEPRVPAFFVDAGSLRASDGKLRVISLATGAVTSTERAPAGTADINFLAEQPQTGNYVAAFISSHAGGLQLYRFRITGAGQITPLTRITGILLRRQPENLTGLALSPDGSRLAVSEIANTIPPPAGTVSGKVVVLNLDNGARQVWNDRLTSKDQWPQITSAAWTPDGKALVFASHICSVRPGERPCFWEFRRLVTAGGALRAGPVLLHQDGMNSQIQAPVVSPDGSSVIEVRGGTGPGANVRLVRISLATGSQSVLARLPAPGPYQAGANEGNFLFVGRQRHPAGDWRLIGWVNDDGFHPLHTSPGL
jgi:WD40 repeat protein